MRLNYCMPRTAELALQHMYTTKLGDMIKLREASEATVKNSLPYVVRVDGVSFSKFTKGIHKPFDDRLTKAMVSTTEDLTDRFNAAVGYHQSDEISLFFTAQPLQKGRKRIITTLEEPLSEESHIYNGRVQKLASVIAAFASVRLNHHIHKHDWTDLPTHIRDKGN